MWREDEEGEIATEPKQQILGKRNANAFQASGTPQSHRECEGHPYVCRVPFYNSKPSYGISKAIKAQPS